MLHMYIYSWQALFVIRTKTQGRDSNSAASQRLPDHWLVGADESAPISSNQPALQIPFQRWFKFKEAFSPQFILQCVHSLDRFPSSCLDPFGGSGTTALTCQLLGVRPTTIEVNPFLADLITSK